MWGHCHHRATGGMDPEQQLLEKMGLQVEPLKGGCCGLAGSWGFEKGKYGISLDCGEQALLPAVRNTPPTTVVVADGFSCKTQIQQAGTGRRALHVGEIMKLARDREPLRATTVDPRTATTGRNRPPQGGCESPGPPR